MTHVHPTRDDPVVRGLSERLGGPVGERVGGPGRRSWWTPIRVLLALTAVCLSLGLLQKAPCIAGDDVSVEARYAQMCYSDLPPLYPLRGFAELEWPYSGDEQVRERYRTMEYPVLISYWAYGAAWVTHALSGSPDLADRAAVPPERLSQREDVDDEITLFFLVNGVGFAALALLAVWLVSRTNPGRPWDAAIVAVSPTLLVASMINWDLLAVACVAGALWAWARDRPVLTGVLIGLGTAAKLYPLFLLGGLLVICLRRRRWGDLALAAVWAGVAWFAVNLPALLGGRAQWQEFWSFNSERGPDLGSVWMLVDQAADLGISAHTVNVGSWAFFVAWCLGVLVLGLRAPETPRLAQLGFLIVAGFLLVNKVYSPQYVLWLLPLAALARPRWRDQLVWQGGELFYFCVIWWYLGGFLQPAGGGDAGVYWIGIAVRVLAELYLVAVVVRDVLAPEHDPARVARWDPPPNPARHPGQSPPAGRTMTDDDPDDGTVPAGRPGDGAAGAGGGPASSRSESGGVGRGDDDRS